MAMINAAEAQQMLSCDDATFSNYVNNGTLRSQRVDGELMVEADDVQSLLAGGGTESSDSILVLDSESEDLAIDLGGTGEDSATIFDSGSGTDQITFGDELEEVNFDEESSEKIDFGDDAEQTVSFDDAEMTVAFDEESASDALSFTESNTAVLTDVDETMTATATSDYQTIEDDFADDGPQRSSGVSSVRRSVRAERVRQPVQKVSVAWLILLMLTLIVCAAAITPYYGMSYWPKENVDHYNGDRAYGIDDNGWSSFAAMVVGFDVEPDADKWRDNNPGSDQPHRPLNQAFPEQVDVWRYKEYQGKYETEEDPEGMRSKHFMISRVEEEQNSLMVVTAPFAPFLRRQMARPLYLYGCATGWSGS